MNIALILASGKGTRFGKETPKQFIEVNGLPLIIYTLSAFEKCNAIDEIVVVTSNEFIPLIESYKDKYNIKKLTKVVLGGETRQMSSYNGLKALNAKDDDIVLIHDAARPLVNERIILDNIKACESADAVVTAIQVTDTTISKSDTNNIKGVIDRNSIVSVQTPQTFKYKLIKEAHEKAKDSTATDDAQLVYKLGKTVQIVEGDKKNIKITTQEDMDYFKFLLK